MERKIVSTLVSFTKSANDEATEGAIYAMPATPLQVRLWKLNLAYDPAWNVAVRFRFSGQLDRVKFDRALQLLATRHEVLRTSLMEHNGEVIQRIVSHVTLPLQWCDLRSLELADQQQEIARLSLEHARQILPLTSTPLLQTGVLQLSDTEHILLWNAHHCICDGWSVGLLVRDLMDCYGALLHGRRTDATHFAGLWGLCGVAGCAAQNVRIRSPQRLLEAAFARASRLRSLPEGVADAKRPERKAPQFNRCCCRVHLTDAIAAVAQRHHSTFFHAVLAAFGLLLRTQQSMIRYCAGNSDQRPRSVGTGKRCRNVCELSAAALPCRRGDVV